MVRFMASPRSVSATLTVVEHGRIGVPTMIVGGLGRRRLGKRLLELLARLDVEFAVRVAEVRLDGLGRDP